MPAARRAFSRQAHTLSNRSPIPDSTSPSRTAQAAGRWLTRVLFVLLLLAFAGGEQAALFSGLNARLGDVLLRWHAIDRQPPADIVLIDIDQASLDAPEMLELAGNWPWPRATHGELVEFIGSARPAAIAFDLIFSEPDLFRPGSDAVLSQAILTNQALLPLVIAGDGQATPLRDLPAGIGARPGPVADPQAALPLIAPKAIDPTAWQTGLINFLADDDQIGRRYWIDYPHRGWTLPSLPRRIAEQSGWAVPARDAIALHWYGHPFQRYSYHEVFLSALRSNGTPPDLKGKIVIIGAAAPGLHDLRPTPLGATTPGPEILATAVANLRDDDWLRPVPAAWNLALGISGMLLVALAFTRRPNPVAIAGALALFSAVVAGSTWLLLDRNIQWMPFSALLAIWLTLALAATASYLRERRQRDQAIQMFARFLDPNVVRSLTDEGRLAQAEASASREITVLFSDIRGFTTISESRPPEEVVRLLNRYFDMQVAAIFEQGGTLDKFIGDAIMAFWNAPLDEPDHAVKAVRAALAMSDSLARFRDSLGDSDARFDIGIGVHTGPAVVGFLGASQRLDYTAIGDTVNLASRIEGETKGVARILVSQATRDACGNVFDFIDHGEVTVKGRHQPVRLFEPRERT
ncbi:adenylate/guanylate cyclase domain-containing protein [uncultured Azonexus sp.]|uniref:adenylate/guanylate cyclase domain-containing protein n=1 Tax=uncultured Azonexus sp. TaxID=520307 RepID=UPI002631C2F2|nr:adenylate/guanylate cyclase domain-containing protein [uncultured Azonexus sp.]